MGALENPCAACSQYAAHKVVQHLFCKFSFQVCQELYVTSLLVPFTRWGEPLLLYLIPVRLIRRVKGGVTRDEKVPLLC